MDKKMVPEVRFKGFTDDWEQHKLKDLLSNQYNGQTPNRSNPSFWNGSINWLSSGELNRDIVKKTNEKITYNGQKNSNLKIIPKGTFVMAITGLEASGTRGNCAILGINTTLNQSCMALFPNKNLLAIGFLFQWYKKYGNEFGIRYTQGTKQQSYNTEIINILPISLPSLNEQMKIHNFLLKVDSLITLQQSQINHFLKLRKGLIQRIFPSNKASNPKIRYTDFNNNWEQRKLKEVTKEISTKSSEGELLSVTINDGIVKNSSLERKNNSSNDKSKYKKVEIGDIAYNSMRMWQGASGVSKYSGIVSPAYTVFKVKENVLNNIFLGYLIKIPEMTWKFRINSQGLTSDTWNLKYPLFSEINIQIPSLKEQDYLVNLLESIDKVICSQTKHLKTLKSLKKYLLQKLFM